MSEKTEKATPYKLKKAKEKGQVSKSQELTLSILFFTAFLYFFISGSNTVTQIKYLMVNIIYLSGRVIVDNWFAINIFHLIISQLISLALPFIVTIILAVIIGTIIQTGFVWSFEPIKPQFNRLNPKAGFNKIISAKLFFETFKNLLKIFITLVVAFLCLKINFLNITNSIFASPKNLEPNFFKLFFKLFFPIILLLFGLAIIDKLYSRWRFLKNQRMSKEEIRDEYRQREGDPKVKNKIKQLQYQLRQKTAALQQVKTADVVITNPTHLAIALKYDSSSMQAPRVVCKAQDEQVQLIRKLALRYGVPIVQHKAFARKLFSDIELNQGIKREHFPIAALIYRKLYEKENS